MVGPEAGPPPADALRIELRSIRVDGRHGVTDEERSRAQPLEVDLDVEADVARAAASDDLSDTIDYAGLAETVSAVVAGTSFRLLEALAGAIADAVMGDPRIRSVRVSVRKLRPPLRLRIATTGVTLTRGGADPGS